jgi:hypothetical protein
MSNLQHERITTLATELRLLAVPDLYGPIAQTAATRKDASYADFLEDVCGPSATPGTSDRVSCSPGWPASRRSRR